MEVNNPMIIEDAHVDRLYRLIKGRIDWDNIVPTCLEIGQHIQQVGNLRGPQKLELLQKTLKHALKESNKSPEEKEAILHKIDTVVPIVMQAAKLSSKIPIQQIQAVCCSWIKK